MSHASRFALAALLSALPLAADLPAQTQGRYSRWQYFGWPCRDESGVMWFARASDSPQLAAAHVTLSIYPLYSVPPTTKAWAILLGASAYPSGLLLPENPFLSGCRLFVAPSIVLPGTFPDFTHPAGITVTWPRNPALLNVSFYFQELRVKLIEHQARFVINASDAVKVTITAI